VQFDAFSVVLIANFASMKARWAQLRYLSVFVMTSKAGLKGTSKANLMNQQTKKGTWIQPAWPTLFLSNAETTQAASFTGRVPMLKHEEMPRVGWNLGKG
jgi:hypothetical protein